MSKVAIVGTGFIGRAWAISFARAGHDVALWDAAAAAPADALAYIDTILPDLAEYDLLGGATPGQVRARMRIATTLEQALGGADHVQENTPEDVEVKRRIFARLDAAAMPQAILASSTSAILPSQFTETLAGRARSWWSIRSIRPTSSRRLKWCRRRGRPPKRSGALPIF